MAGTEGLSVSLLRNRHAGADIWVIGAGASAGFVEPEFFDGKVTIGVNYTWERFDVDYVVAKEGFAVKDALRAGRLVVASQYHCGNIGFSENYTPGTLYSLYIFRHENNEIDRIDLDVVGSHDHLVVSYSTITSAMHLAAFMGAGNIILVGHDCGTVDGQENYDGYRVKGIRIDKPEFYGQFISVIEPQTMALKAKLYEVYGCRTYSLNPFINFGLEGHTWKRGQ